MEPPPPFSYLFCRLLQTCVCSDDPVTQKILETTELSAHFLCMRELLSSQVMYKPIVEF